MTHLVDCWTSFSWREVTRSGNLLRDSTNPTHSLYTNSGSTANVYEEFCAERLLELNLGSVEMASAVNSSSYLCYKRI